MAGNFVVLAAGGSEDRGALVEDGYALSFTAASWKLVREALEEGKPLSLPKPMGGFEIVWPPTDYRDPVTSVTHRAPEGWQLYLPDKPRPPAAGPVVVDQIVLLTPQDEIARRTSTDVLVSLINQVEEAVIAEVTATPVQGAVTLLVDYDGERESGEPFGIAFQLNPPRPFADRLHQRLNGLALSPMKRVRVHLQVHYRINAAVAPEAAPARP